MELNGHKAFMKKAPVATIIFFYLNFIAGKHFHTILLFMGKTFGSQIYICSNVRPGPNIIKLFCRK